MSRRTREIGIRMALGASAADVLKPIIGHALAMTVTGVAVGLGLSILFGRAISGLLYGISATDPVTYVLIPLTLGLVAAAASYIPARRAAKVDPMAALRYE
ncbi:MAG TPA: FtsX-like permease family protein [Blastocatellia bacterium]|nr:FtsX-like permease family protein [Blastocatellia bacterium]